MTYSHLMFEGHVLFVNDTSLKDHNYMMLGV